MPAKSNLYRERLSTLENWDDFLLQESGLPGPRGNLELAQVVADLGSLAQFEHFISFNAQSAPTNDPHEFLAFCGVVGLGRLIAEGQTSLIYQVRPFASDSRWRLREATAMALQHIGVQNMPLLLEITHSWALGNWYEKRAAVAALAEPVLLQDPEVIHQALDLFDQVTAALLLATDRKAEDFRVLRQGLGYAWSVVVAADPDVGKPYLEKWLVNPDVEVRWIMHENLKKKRLERIDPGWVVYWREMC
jgi:hypothetical protein